MKPSHLSILFVGILPFGACSTYETSTAITPTEQPGKYWAQAKIVKHQFLQAPRTVSSPSMQFSPAQGAESSSGIGHPGDETSQVTSVRIFPTRKSNPQAVEVHYHIDEQPGHRALDRREWVPLPDES